MSSSILDNKYKAIIEKIAKELHAIDKDDLTPAELRITNILVKNNYGKFVNGMYFIVPGEQ